MRLRQTSLTLRLTLLFALVSSTVVAVIGFVFYVSLDAHFLHEDAIELRGKMELVRNIASRVQAGGASLSMVAQLEDALVGHHNLHLELRGRNGDRRFSVPDTPSAVQDPARAEVNVARLEGLTVRTVEVSGNRYRVTSFDLPEHALVATLSMNVDHHQMFMRRVLDTVLLTVALGALAAAALGWAAARVGIAPLRAFSSLASRISADRLDDRLVTHGLPPELALLGRSFNDMLARLEDSFRRLKEFSSDLAHELRTPIGALMTQAQVALSRARTEDEYREVIYSAMEEYDRLARMTTDMLLLAKADAGSLMNETVRFDIRPEIEALFEFYDALAESKGIALAVVGEGTVRGDRMMFRRAVSNLLSNAIRHAKSATTVAVTIDHDNGGTKVSITNQGVAIPGEHLDRLFDRFYMVDQSRNRMTDGTGLGLAITKTIVEAHGGAISVESNPRETRFEIRLPAVA